MLTYSVYLLASMATAVNYDHNMFITFVCRKYLLSIFIFFSYKSGGENVCSGKGSMP